MSKTAVDKTLALAGIFQAAALVSSLAVRGRCDGTAKQASIDSLFNFDAEKTVDVFGGLDGIRYGLRQLCEHIGSGAESTATLRYALTLMKLASTASKTGLLEAIADDLQPLAPQWHNAEADPEAAPPVIHQLSASYAKIISPLQPRVIVNGDPQHLQNDHITTLIRALLLAGIRSAVLWSQSGGNRWYLITSRKRMIFEAEKLLNTAS